MNVKEYLKRHTSYFDSNTKIAYFKTGYICNKLF